jgi:NAD(P)-dependent dehydrogenase (short-subunit alcohol dehydrogenase family)
MVGGTVVITGASTGIGHAAALRLAASGFDVHAGVRDDAAAERLRAAGVKPLRIDVTDAGSVAEAARVVGEAVGGGGLAGLVNNAGIAVSGPVELIPLDEWRRQLEVNLIGQIATIQAFLPLLRAARGRIVNVSSIGGRVALPLVGPYAASKFALEGISDSLRRELRGQGVDVAVIEPGAVKTPIWDKGMSEADEIEAGMSAEGRRLYGGLIDALRRQVDAIQTERGIEPDAVAEAILHALSADRPRTRYLVGRDAKVRALAARLLPDRVFDALVARELSK